MLIGKKNDFATFLVYIAMFAIAVVVGLLVISPFMGAHTNDQFGINKIVLLIICVIGGVIFNAALIEVGHVLGALIGKYEIVSVCVLGFTIAKKENGKKGVTFGNFDGLSGETKIIPRDEQKSSPSAYILMPIVLFIVELIVMMVLIQVGLAKVGDLDYGWTWVVVFSEVFLTVGGMLYLYDIVPVRLDSVTDGFLLILLNRPANKVAYNQFLLRNHAIEEKQEVKPLPIYDEITDFTASLNLISVYSLIDQSKYKEANAILEKTIKAEKGVPAARVNEAVSLHLSLTFMQGDLKASKKEYEEITDAQRTYIAGIPTISACRCYALISGLIDDSENETEFALGKTERLFKKSEPNELPAEKKTFELAVEMIRKAHPDWDLTYIVPIEKEEKSRKKDSEENQD